MAKPSQTKFYKLQRIILKFKKENDFSSAYLAIE